MIFSMFPERRQKPAKPEIKDPDKTGFVLRGERECTSYDHSENRPLFPNKGDLWYCNRCHTYFTADRLNLCWVKISHRKARRMIEKRKP